jgi:hypothetical protein
MAETDLSRLRREIPYKWRVQSFSKNVAKASCVAYIDARDVMDILDDVVGPENWQDQYSVTGDYLMAGIGIKTGSEWVWKWDTGSKSDIEEEKGLVSDAFKRAAVKWGIGRFLYAMDVQYVVTDGPKSESHKYPSVIDASGKKVWDITEHINSNKHNLARAK